MSHGLPTGDHVALTADQDKARRRRNVMLALAIAGFMVLLFLITLARINAGGVQ